MLPPTMIPALPPLGAAVRREFALTDDFLTVNHGSYGATPGLVLAAQDAWRQRMEAQPTRFFAQELPAALRAVAARLAEFVGAYGEDLAFVSNATMGCNAVLRSLALEPGDEILCLGHVYNAVRNTMRHVSAGRGARLVMAELPFPRPDRAEVIARLDQALGPRTRLAVLDHIFSSSALVLPIADMVAHCHARGVPVLVDGAHGPGQVPLDLTALGADYYVGNCHKWLMAPKGSAFLHVRRDRQSGLHPVTISHGFEQGFLAEFDWTGTDDPSAFLAVPAALDFFAQLGGAALMARNAALAAASADAMAARLGTEVGAASAMRGAMGLVRLPVARAPGEGAATQEQARTLRRVLLAAGTDAPINAIAGAFWLRLSAHAYNEDADYQRLAALVEKVLAKAA
ncbi:MAG: aminotransferase class V-fold PLP-dependent enzyme [Reyranellaceae bacterium]